MQWIDACHRVFAYCVRFLFIRFHNKHTTDLKRHTNLKKFEKNIELRSRALYARWCVEYGILRPRSNGLCRKHAICIWIGVLTIIIRRVIKSLVLGALGRFLFLMFRKYSALNTPRNGYMCNSDGFFMCKCFLCTGYHNIFRSQTVAPLYVSATRRILTVTPVYRLCIKAIRLYVINVRNRHVYLIPSLIFI